MKKQLILITLLCLGASSTYAMESLLDLSKEESPDSQSEHHCGNSLRFLGTPPIFYLLGMSLAGRNALKGLSHIIIAGDSSNDTLISTALNATVAIGCGYVTYEYGL